MVKREITIPVIRTFCDFCDKMEEFDTFRQCMICGKTACPDCEILIRPLAYNKVNVCKECLSPEFEKIIELRKQADTLHEQITDLTLKEMEIVTQMRAKRGK